MCASDRDTITSLPPLRRCGLGPRGCPVFHASPTHTVKVLSFSGGGKVNHNTLPPKLVRLIDDQF